MTPGLPLLLLALALRGGAEGTAPVSPPDPRCGAAALAAILGRLRDLEGQVRALQDQCGDSRGPQAGTGTWEYTGGHGRDIGLWGGMGIWGHGGMWGYGGT